MSLSDVADLSMSLSDVAVPINGDAEQRTENHLYLDWGGHLLLAEITVPPLVESSRHLLALFHDRLLSRPLARSIAFLPKGTRFVRYSGQSGGGIVHYPNNSPNTSALWRSLGDHIVITRGDGSRPHQKMLWGGESSERVRLEYPGEGTHPMHQETFELNCSRTSLAIDGTLVVVVEMSLSTWLVCAEVPGLERRAMMKMSVDEAELLSQLHR